jgi:hypothetical protein
LKRRAALVLIGAAALAGSLGYPALRRAVSAALERRHPLDINLDHGLADCPWPDGVDRLDPAGEVEVEDRDVVVRTDERVYLAERAVSVKCSSAYLLGPIIIIELRTDRSDRRDPAPPLDPSVDHARDDLPAALTAYRVALGVMDRFDLSAEEAARGRQSLGQWYSRGDHSMKGGASLETVGTLASGAVEVALFQGPHVVASFSFRTDRPDPNLEIALGKLRDGGIPRDFLEHPPSSRICIWGPKDAGSSWQPPPRTQAEIDRSWFKPCPE